MFKKSKKLQDGGISGSKGKKIEINQQALNAVGKVFGGIGQATSKVQGNTNFTDEQQSVRSAVLSAAQSNPWSAIFATAGDILDKTVGSADHVNEDAAKKAGMKDIMKAQDYFQMIPGHGWIANIFTTKTDKAAHSDILDQNRSDFGGIASSMDAAKELGNKRIWQGGKANSYIADAKLKVIAADKILKDNKKRLNSQSSADFAAQNLNRFSGTTGALSLKHGAKFPELDEARNILSTLRSSRIEKHQNGGVIGEDSNIIPNGALHKNKNHIEEANPELEGQITKKGIPVVSMDEGGEISQIAEVEENELTLSKSSSYTLESFYEKYKNTSEDEKNEIEVEVGKWIADQILHNTQDNTGLIKEIKA